METILITGGTGFLGSHLVKSLLSDGYKIILLKRSSSNTARIGDCLDRITSHDIDRAGLEDAFAAKIDIIIHCATNYGRSEVEHSSILEANLILPLELLQLGNRRGVPCFINTDTILDKRVSYYSLSKSQFKEWLKLYSKDMTCINVALEHFYGPEDDRSKFVTSIIQNIINNVDKIDLTEGRQRRDFIYIDDVIDAFMKIIRNCVKKEKGFFNYEIGTGKPIEIRNFVSLVKRIAGNDRTFLNFGAVPYRENEIMEYNVNLSEINKLGWRPRNTLEDGLRKTIDNERELIKS